MLKFGLIQNDKNSNKRFATSEKSPIFQSHKSYKIPLPTIVLEENLAFKESKIYH
jgi:hypothetical protein